MTSRILEHWRVLVATVCSVLLVVGVYVFGRGSDFAPVAQASMESALLQAVATKDSDEDGLPDWEEALYGTDPKNKDSSRLGMTDGEAVSRGLIVPLAVTDTTTSTSASSTESADTDNTLTAAFARTFFTYYLAAKKAKEGGDLTEEEMNEVASKSLESLSSTVAAAPDFKSKADLVISGSGQEALKAFAAHAEDILLKNTATASTSEIAYLTQVVQKGDTSVTPHIASIANAYKKSAAGLATLPVPTEIVAEDLAVINALMRAGQVISDFTVVNTDPLVTMLALKQYPQTVLDLGNAFIKLGVLYKAAGITLPAGTPGASFVNLMKDLAGEQASTKKP